MLRRGPNLYSTGRTFSIISAVVVLVLTASRLVLLSRTTERMAAQAIAARFIPHIFVFASTAIAALDMDPSARAAFTTVSPFALFIERIKVFISIP